MRKIIGLYFFGTRQYGWPVTGEQNIYTELALVYFHTPVVAAARNGNAGSGAAAAGAPRAAANPGGPHCRPAVDGPNTIPRVLRRDMRGAHNRLRAVNSPIPRGGCGLPRAYREHGPRQVQQWPMQLRVHMQLLKD